MLKRTLVKLKRLGGALKGLSKQLLNNFQVYNLCNRKQLKTEVKNRDAYKKTCKPRETKNDYDAEVKHKRCIKYARKPVSQREKCPNTRLFLVRMFLYSD